MSRQIGFQISVRGAGGWSVFDFALPLVQRATIVGFFVVEIEV